jgi:hypothetical protein
MEVKDMAEKKVAYLNSKSWAEVTREERFFCAELFSLIREDETRGPFFDLLGIKGKEQASFDVGLEVCFYRDVLKAYGKEVSKTDFSQKRTFDLALMSDTDLYLIEAKAHGGFSSNDLANIKKDNAGKDSIKELFESLKVKSPTVHTVALISSGYDPKQSTKDCFEKVVTWDKVAEAYKDNERAHEIFKRADEVYGD